MNAPLCYHCGLSATHKSPDGPWTWCEADAGPQDLPLQPATIAEPPEPRSGAAPRRKDTEPEAAQTQAAQTAEAERRAAHEKWLREQRERNRSQIDFLDRQIDENFRRMGWRPPG